ncbi:MAG TPA: hypothetical protein ENJ06_06490 [Phycisphaeraceae bacterium]|nr:hypothetical protein [Phycisphaeraceae bacterium]
MIRLREIATVIVLTAGAAMAQQMPAVPGAVMPADIGQRMSISDYTVQTLDLPAEAGEGFAVWVNIDGVDRVLLLHPYSMEAPNYRLMVQDETGVHEVPSSDVVTTYRGIVVGVADSGVAASLINGQLNAIIDMGHKDMWFVQPLSEVVPDASPLDHVVYFAEDSIEGDWHCGNDALGDLPGSGDSVQDDFGTRTPGNDLAEVAFDADFEFYQDNGSSVANTEADIQDVMNQVDFIYDRDTQINYTITTIIVRTNSNDPYTSTDAGTRLDQFRTEWNNNQGGVQRDLAHLMTGASLDGSVIGVAWLGVVCNTSLAYGLSESNFSFNMNFRVSLTAHEMGHNWNADHCDQDGGGCHIMCSAINSCGGVGSPNFGTRSINSITSFANTRPCLDTVANDSGLDHQVVEVPISADAIADDGTLANAKTYDLQAVVTLDDDWTSTDVTTTLDGTIYQHPTFDDSVPQPAFWPTFPSIEYDSFFSARDFAVPGFAEGPDVTPGSMHAIWFDTENTGNGTYTIGRFTVLSGTTLNIAGTSTANHTGGQLIPFNFNIDVTFPGIDHQVVEVPISADAIADDPTLDGAKTFDLQVVITQDDDWTSTDTTATIDGTIYQHPTFDDSIPQPAFWPTFPSLEFDSFFSARDFAAPGFASGPDVTNNSMSAIWFDTENTGNGTYTIARFTVTSGTLLSISGTSTARSTAGELHPFSFDVNVDLNPPCPGDLNGDGQRDQADLGILLASYLINDGGDIDGDGDTDQADLGALLSVYLVPCP